MSLNSPLSVSPDSPPLVGSQPPLSSLPPFSLPPPAPVSRPPRTLCLCFDGTGNKFGRNSNVVRLFRALKKDNDQEQLAYYQAGIGTYAKHQFITHTMAKIHYALDQALARGISDHVLDGYRFLMQNYRPGDKICLFGFSRGAYTARALAGMLYKVGLLPKGNEQQVDFAFSIYKGTDTLAANLSNEFKETFALPVEVEFLGVWDTVSSVGLIPRELPYSTTIPGLKVFRHALALDECRARFRPKVWNEPPAVDEEIKHGLPKPLDLPDNLKERDDWNFSPPDSTTDVLEVWFAGCHADIGGGSHPSLVPDSLSSIPLRWMIAQCREKVPSMKFDDTYLRSIGIDDTPGPKVMVAPLPSRALVSGSEHRVWTEIVHKTLGPNEMAVLDFIRDELEAGETVYNQLKAKLAWWMLELLPMLTTYQDPKGVWARRRVRNFGQGRVISHYNDRINIHSSVLQRIRENDKYVPSAYNWEQVLESKMVRWVN